MTSPCTPVPVGLALDPKTPFPYPLVAFETPSTPVPPVAELFTPNTPTPLGLALDPLVPVVFPVVLIAWPLTPVPLTLEV